MSGRTERDERLPDRIGRHTVTDYRDPARDVDKPREPRNSVTRHGPCPYVHASIHSRSPVFQFRGLMDRWMESDGDAAVGLGFGPSFAQGQLRCARLRVNTCTLDSTMSSHRIRKMSDDHDGTQNGTHQSERRLQKHPQPQTEQQWSDGADNRECRSVGGHALSESLLPRCKNHVWQSSGKRFDGGPCGEPPPNRERAVTRRCRT